MDRSISMCPTPAIVFKVTWPPSFFIALANRTEFFAYTTVSFFPCNSSPRGASDLAKVVGLVCSIMGAKLLKMDLVDLVFNGLNACGPANETQPLIIFVDAPALFKYRLSRAKRAAICAPAQWPIRIIFCGLFFCSYRRWVQTIALAMSSTNAGNWTSG